MDEALWCVTYGVLWWWVVLMMRDGAWQATTSAYNAKLRTNVGICLGTRHTSRSSQVQITRPKCQVVARVDGWRASRAPGPSPAPSDAACK